MSKNNYKLSRKISSKTSKKIRKRCGFGCVVCGCSIIEYHHFNPPFAEAKFHDENGITLLCGTCHDKVHKGIISSENLADANKNPYCKNKGYAKDILYLGKVTLPVKIGSSTFHARTIFLYDNHVVFGFNEPETPMSPIRLNAIFTDNDGKEILKIEDNEWIVGSDCFDVTIKKSTLKITNKQNEVIFEMNLAVNNSIEINQINMNYNGFMIKINDGTFSLTTPIGSVLNHNGGNYSDIGIWMKSDGHVKIAANKFGGAAIQM
jgi:hypothetical protein